jgi:hypothetical protein
MQTMDDQPWSSVAQVGVYSTVLCCSLVSSAQASSAAGCALHAGSPTVPLPTTCAAQGLNPRTECAHRAVVTLIYNQLATFGD